MFRKKFAGSYKPTKDRIRRRGHEVTRIEALSDAVFAFAVTLLIVSLEVPKDFEELMEGMKSFLPFLLCSTMLFQVWIVQNIFFRRYGMHDDTTIILNAILLFVVLFFVYPLKFLFSGIISNDIAFHDVNKISKLFLIYSGGFTIIYLLFALMYANAWLIREELELTPSEVFETKTNIYRNLGMSSVGIASILLAATFTPAGASFAGLVYMFIGPMIGIIHSKRGKIHKKLFGPDTATAKVSVEIVANDDVEKVPGDRLN